MRLAHLLLGSFSLALAFSQSVHATPSSDSAELPVRASTDAQVCVPPTDQPSSGLHHVCATDTAAHAPDATSAAAAQALLREAITSRRAVRAYAPTPIPDAVLAEVLRLTQRAPTAYNMQPYSVVVLRDQADREKIVDAMLGPNGDKVKEAPVVVVFAADTRPSQRVPRIQKLLRDNGTPEMMVDYIPEAVAMFSGDKIYSPNDELSDEPSTDPKTLAWAYKQTTFAAATFLYTAHASGLVTSPMEGFDGAKLRAALEIPDRYSIPVVISCGYPKAETPAGGVATPRLPPTEIFFEGKFGESSEKIFE